MHFGFRGPTLLVVLAFLVILLATGTLRLKDRGVIRAIREIIRLAPEVEQRNQEIRDLSAP